MVSELETTLEGPRGDALVEHVAGLLLVVGLLVAADSQPILIRVATIMKSKWTANGCRFPLTRLATSSRPMVALTSALQNR
jgi:hypothetical protein